MAEYPALIAVFGPTGTGKSTFVNNASGGDLAVGNDLTSCTQDVAASNLFKIDGRNVQLIDTPGFDDTEVSDAEILQRISGYLSTSYKMGYKLTGIIYLHRITDTRMGGISRRTFQIFRELCGQKSLANVLVVTTMWSDPPNDVQIKREKQLKEDSRYYQPAIRAGSQLVRCLHNDPDSARDIVRMLLDKNPVIMKVQSELVDEGKDFHTIGAAQILKKELAEMEQRHKEDMAQIKEELRQAKENKDTQAQEELRQFLAQTKAESAKVAKEVETLRHGFDGERARWEQRINDAIREREQAERRQTELSGELERLRRQADRAQEEEKRQLEEKVRQLTARLEKPDDDGICVIM